MIESSEFYSHEKSTIISSFNPALVKTEHCSSHLRGNAPIKTQLVASVGDRCNMNDESNKRKEAHVTLHLWSTPQGVG